MLLTDFSNLIKLGMSSTSSRPTPTFYFHWKERNKSICMHVLFGALFIVLLWQSRSHWCRPSRLPNPPDREFGASGKHRTKVVGVFLFAYLRPPLVVLQPTATQLFYTRGLRRSMFGRASVSIVQLQRHDESLRTTHPISNRFGRQFSKRSILISLLRKERDDGTGSESNFFLN